MDKRGTRLTYQNEQQVRYGQAEQIVIGGGLHGVCPRYDQAGTHVADHAREED